MSSAKPTVAPTRVPTEAPTSGPILANAPTFAPTFWALWANPTFAPNTAVPTVPFLQAMATVEYQIGLDRGTVDTGSREADYVADLQVAMNDLAFQVGMETFPPPTDGGRRRLQVMVKIPTFGGVVDNIGTYSDVRSLLLVLSHHKRNSTVTPTHNLFSLLADCAIDFGRVTDERDLCQTVASEISLSLTGEDQSMEAKHVETYEVNLFQAIYSGRLQESMDELFPGAAVSILTGTGADSNNLSAGATAGISIAALLLVLVPITIFLVRRQRGRRLSR
jgi:hypothetical protein